jgi:hypothetical protein
MLFFRVPAADSTRQTYTDRLNEACSDLYDGDALSTNMYSITYTDTSGVEWACPGNGDAALTREVVTEIAAMYASTNMDIFYREQSATKGLTRVEPKVSDVG